MEKKRKILFFPSILLIRFSDTLQKHYCCKLISGIPECLWARQRQRRLSSSTSFGTGSHASSVKGPYFCLSFFLLLIYSWKSVDLHISDQIQCWDAFIFSYLHIQIESPGSSWVTCCALHLFLFYLNSVKSSLFINKHFWLLLIYCSLWKPLIEHRGGHPCKSIISLRPLLFSAWSLMEFIQAHP